MGKLANPNSLEITNQLNSDDCERFHKDLEKKTNKVRLMRSIVVFICTKKNLYLEVFLRFVITNVPAKPASVMVISAVPVVGKS